MQQPTHLSGFVQPDRVAKREVVRPEYPDVFVHRPRRTLSAFDRTIKLAGRRVAFPQGLIGSWCKRRGYGAPDDALVGWCVATVRGTEGR
jgi:hypothetical protein